MPDVFLSPSTQEGNPYVVGGNEAYYMNQLTDAMEPLLDLAGISYGRNDREGNVRTSVDMSNEGDYKLHLALHSNASPVGFEGVFQGPYVFYHPASAQGERSATMIAEGLRRVYPHPDLPRTVPSTNLYELREARAPVAFLEVAFHDNEEDATWIAENILPIADNLVESLAEYFGVPYAQPLENDQGVVMLRSGSLNVRQAPDLSAPVLYRLYNGDSVTLLRAIPNWYLIHTDQGNGFVSQEYVYPV